MVFFFLFQERNSTINVGRVAEQGTHEQLMTIDQGLYKTLVSRQLKADD